MMKKSDMQACEGFKKFPTAVAVEVQWQWYEEKEKRRAGGRGALFDLSVEARALSVPH